MRILPEKGTKWCRVSPAHAGDCLIRAWVKDISKLPRPCSILSPKPAEMETRCKTPQRVRFADGAPVLAPRQQDPPAQQQPKHKSAAVPKQPQQSRQQQQQPRQPPRQQQPKQQPKQTAAVSQQGKASKANLQRACVVCYDDHDPSAGIECPSDDKHFLCNSCFGHHVTTESETEALDLLHKRGGGVFCPACPIGDSGLRGTPYADAAIARHVSDEVFEVYLKAKAKLTEQRLAKEIGDAERARLEAEYAPSKFRFSVWVELSSGHAFDRTLD